MGRHKKGYNPMATLKEVAASNVKVFDKTYKYFDLNSFTEVSESVKVNFTPPADYEEAASRLGNDPDAILKALISFLQRQTLLDSKRASQSKGADRKIVLAFIKPFRSFPPYSLIEDRKEQTQAILNAVKGNAFMVESIKAASLAALTSEDDEDEEGDSDDSDA